MNRMTRPTSPAEDREGLTRAVVKAMQAHQDGNGLLPEHARYHCGGTCGYDIARRLAALPDSGERAGLREAAEAVIASDPTTDRDREARDRTERIVRDVQNATAALHRGVDLDELEQAAAEARRELNVDVLATAMWNVLYPDPASREANDNAYAIAAEYRRLMEESR